MTAEEGVSIDEAVEAAMKSLDEDRRTLLREKLAGLPDLEMAVSRSISRRTIACARKQAVFVVLEWRLAELERALQVAVLDRSA